VADKVKDLRDVVRLGLRLVNREQGSEARNLLERECRRLRVATRDLAGYDTDVSGHLQLASAIRSGLGDVGVASEPAALAHGLAFVPLVTERCDLVVRRAALHSPEVQGLLLSLQSGWLRPQLDALPGYDAAMCGEVVEGHADP
jgi:putative molybdopterin biosynthesis protein